MTMTTSASLLQNLWQKMEIYPLPPAEESRSEHVVRNRVASGSNQNPATTAWAEGDFPSSSTKSKDPTSTGTDGRVDGGPNGE